jgi:hypothetical protein
MSATKKTTQPLKEKSDAKVIPLYGFRGMHSPETKKLVDCIWNISNSALWLNKHFNLKEKENLKELIAQHFYNGKSSQLNFKELVELICLVKRYDIQGKPQEWLGIHHPLGIESVDDCLEKLRKTIPEHSQGIQTFIHAVLKFMESPSSTTYFKYRMLLMKQRQFDLLQILNNTIIHFQFKL